LPHADYESEIGSPGGVGNSGFYEEAEISREQKGAKAEKYDFKNAHGHVSRKEKSLILTFV
jgi:hypothetical protein